MPGNKEMLSGTAMHYRAIGKRVTTSGEGTTLWGWPVMIDEDGDERLRRGIDDRSRSMREQGVGESIWLRGAKGGLEIEQAEVRKPS